MFLNKIRNIFCVPDTKFVSAANVARAGKRGNICVCNNVSSFARALRPAFIGTTKKINMFLSQSLLLLRNRLNFSAIAKF